MSKKNVTHYACDVLACNATGQADFKNGVEEGEPPTSWGFISIHRLRGNGNLGMWLCPEHFGTIDDWWYQSAREAEAANA